MFDLGDDLIIDSYRIPWLIWIQILVMFLLTLIILLSYFGFIALDSSSAIDTLSISSSRLESPSTSCKTTQVTGNHDPRREIVTGTGNRRRGVENNLETDDSSVKDLASAPTSKRIYHPCRYFDLAKQAFLKCLGLGSSSLNSAARDHEHDD